jgi:beta-glucosidase
MQDIYWQLNDADAVVAVMGLSPLLEGENGDAYLSEAGGDKKDIEFPYAQLKYLRKLKEKTNKPLIVIITTGSAIALGEVEKIADAVLIAWYPGEEGGNAAADILFGNTNPSGRLPVTFYKSTNDLPAFTDYSMKGRTYRYFTGNTLHPFGFGLSYSNFTYSNLTVTQKATDVHVAFSITNSSNIDGEEVAQLYVRRINKNANEPLLQLKNIKRLKIAKGETVATNLTVTKKDLEYWDDKQQQYVVYPGDYEIMIGSSSADIRLRSTITIK